MTILNDRKPELDDYYIEHHGVKGMKWGVRRQRRLAQIRRVAEGRGSRGDKLKVGLLEVSAKNRRVSGGLQGAAANKVRSMESRKRRIKAGRAHVGDLLAQMGGDRIIDISYRKNPDYRNRKSKSN